MVVYVLVCLVWLLTFAYIGYLRDEKTELAAEAYRLRREVELLRAHIDYGPQPIRARAQLTLLVKDNGDEAVN
jgi:hypothetical protein